MFLEKEQFSVIEIVLVAILGVNILFLLGTGAAMGIKLLAKRAGRGNN